MAGPVETGRSLAGARSRPRSWCWCSFGVPRLVPRVVQSQAGVVCVRPLRLVTLAFLSQQCRVCTALVFTCVRVPCTKLDACETHPRTASPFGLPVHLFPQLFSLHVVLTSKAARHSLFSLGKTHTTGARTSVCLSVCAQTRVFKEGPDTFRDTHTSTRWTWGRLKTSPVVDGRSLVEVPLRACVRSSEGHEQADCFGGPQSGVRSQ